MRHLWTTATSEQTVTHDAGEPEWLDLPVQGYVFRGELPDERPAVQALNPKWLLLTCWQFELDDVGKRLYADMFFKDPNGNVLLASPLDPPDDEDYLSTNEYAPEPFILPIELEEIGYTIDGVYTYRIEWSGSSATRDIGEFSLYISHKEE